MASKRKVVRSTNAQIQSLVDFMAANPLFALGQFTGPLGAQRIEAEWVKLKQILSDKGPDKTVDQWKHTWRDLKKRARDEGGRARHARALTGNATIVPEVSAISLKILGTIGPECAVGIGAENETAIGGSVLDEDPWVAEVAPEQPSTSAAIEIDPPGPSSGTPRRPPSAPRRRRTRLPSREGPMAQYLSAMRQQTLALEATAAANATTARLLRRLLQKKMPTAFKKLNPNLSL